MSEAFERWLRSVCFQKPTPEAYDLAKCAWDHMDAKLQEAEERCELERLRLAACSTAARQNTEASIAERIDRSNPYWSASYGDVCDAVDREMAMRSSAEAAEETGAKATRMMVAAIAEQERLKEALAADDPSSHIIEWKSRAEAAEAENARLHAEVARLRDALVSSTDLLVRVEKAFTQAWCIDWNEPSEQAERNRKALEESK